MKYFCVSDVHSFASELKAALASAGFDKKAEDHALVVLGDVFDRGPDTRGVYRFLKSIDESRLILIKGNHEDLFEELLGKQFPDDYDFGNGTVKTFCQIAGAGEELGESYGWRLLRKQAYADGKDAHAIIVDTWRGICAKVRRSAIRKWLASDRWHDYFEVGPYVMTHAFIPANEKLSDSGYLWPLTTMTPLEGWRELESFERAMAWHDARWTCPYEAFDSGLFEFDRKAGKTLVCGHWHASAFHMRYEGRPNDDSVFFGDGLIAIDACTARSGKVNVLVIDEDMKAYDRLGGKPLERRPFDPDGEGWFKGKDGRLRRIETVSVPPEAAETPSGEQDR